MSKSLDDKIKEAVATAAGEVSAGEAYQRVLDVLERQLDDYEFVWTPRFDSSNFESWRGARAQLLDDITLVRALLAHHRGDSIPTKYVPPRRKVTTGYGER